MSTPLIEAIPAWFNPIFIAYAALILMALIPIFFGSFHALEEVKVISHSFYSTDSAFVEGRSRENEPIGCLLVPSYRIRCPLWFLFGLQVLLQGLH